MQYKINAWILSIWFLMPAILYPLNALQIPPFRSGIAMLLFLVSIIVNRFHVNKLMVTFIIVYMMVIVINMLVKPEGIADFLENKEVWIRTIMFGIMALCFAATSYDDEYVINVMYKIGMISVVDIILCMCTDSIFSIIITLDGWYMLLGFSLMLPLSVIAVYLYTNGISRNKIGAMIYIAGLIMMVIYGNRGSWMCHAVLYLLLVITYAHKRNAIKRYSMYFISLCATFVALKEKILELLVGILSGVDLEFSYAWDKMMKYSTSGDMERLSAGRLEIWDYAINSLSNNLFWGNHIGFIHEVSSSVHNIFLEILCDYGLFVWLAFLVFLIYRIYEYIVKRSMGNFGLLIVFASCACEQLTSGYMFLENNIMCFLGLLMTYKYSVGKWNTDRMNRDSIDLSNE